MSLSGLPWEILPAEGGWGGAPGGVRPTFSQQGERGVFFPGVPPVPGAHPTGWGR
ncbi:hypothetical protein HMPREF0290_1931 [Corynebacterium efficiens YS-314]|nr:hypothetical protein HMPREF0290_1931 [Corynebacterium efficiens YS-314]